MINYIFKPILNRLSAIQSALIVINGSSLANEELLKQILDELKRKADLKENLTPSGVDRKFVSRIPHE